MRRKMRARQESCAHEMKVSVESAGMVRSVCSDCGHVSFSASGEITGQVARNRFARRADTNRPTGVLEGVDRQ